MVSATVIDVAPQDFVKEYAAHLKRAGKLPVPEWVDLVKTGVHKELAPYDKDWFYVRAAAIARKVYLNNGLGVGQITKIYGGSKRRGTRPNHFSRSSSSIARAVLKSLEHIKVIAKTEEGGRRVTVDGQRDLDRIAGQVVAKLAKN